jgi:hypothetical protein
MDWRGISKRDSRFSRDIGMIRVADDEKLKRTAKWENSKELVGAAHRIVKMTPTLWILATNYHHTT